MMPFGNLVINLIQLKDFDLFFLFYAVFSLALLASGIILVSKGIEILEGKL